MASRVYQANYEQGNRLVVAKGGQPPSVNHRVYVCVLTHRQSHVCKPVDEHGNWQSVCMLSTACEPSVRRAERARNSRLQRARQLKTLRYP